MKSDDAYKINSFSGRLKMCLTNFSRLYMMKFIDGNIDDNDLVRIHTDGIVLSKEYDFSKLEYYPKSEEKTTGFMCYDNALYGYHICPNCNSKMKFKQLEKHKCNVV